MSVRRLVLPSALAALAVPALTLLVPARTAPATAAPPPALAHLAQLQSARDGAVAVSRTALGGHGRAGCPDVRDVAPMTRRDAPPRPDRLLSGGCVLRASGELRVYVLSVVEEVHFATCDMEARLRIDGTGGVGLEDVTLLGRTPCNDIRPCQDAERRTLPMHGQVRYGDDGRLRLNLDACLDSCLGRFAGPLRTGLDRDARGDLQFHAPDAPVGVSGLRLDGDLGLTAGRRGLAIDPSLDALGSERRSAAAARAAAAGRPVGQMLPLSFHSPFSLTNGIL